MRIGVVGTGYVGLVTGVCLASKGHDVICYDLIQDKIDKINQAKSPIHEKNLSNLLEEVIQKGTLKSELFNPSKSLLNDLLLIAVGTPTENEKIDLSQLKTVITDLGLALRDHSKFISFVIKSTVIPGTTDSFVRSILENNSRKKVGDFGLGMNPEFLREGEAVEDFMFPDRIVLGAEDSETSRLLEIMYKPWNVPKIHVNSRTAELIKYANNALLATQISAINEMANIAAAVGGIDIMDVVHGISLDSRWSPRLDSGERVRPGILEYLKPGCGFGGSCFPKDVKALRTFADDLGVQPRILQSVLDVNSFQSKEVLKLLDYHLDSIHQKKVLILGLSFKPGTDDVRESVALTIIKKLIIKGASVIAHDPIALKNAQYALSDIKGVDFVKDWRVYLENVDIIIVTTLWEEYYALLEPANLNKISSKIFIDCRRGFDPTNFQSTNYLGIGYRAI